MGKLMAFVAVFELVIGTVISYSGVMKPGMELFGLICTFSLMMFSMITLALFVKNTGGGGAGYNGYNNGNVIKPWMQANQYFANQAMRRDLDRMTQLSEEQAIRERIDRGY